MKKVVRFVLAVVAFAAFSLTSCKKCEECHYDGPNGEVELGEFCDEELEDMEANGYVADSVTYEVHCHEH
jgi:hypothetical protein